MNLDRVEQWIGWMGGLAVLVTLSVLFYGILRGLRRPVGRTTGSLAGILRKPLFYLLASVAYFGLCYLLWQPLSRHLPATARLAGLIFGTPLFSAGLVLILWGRLALGKWYFVSASTGAQLFAGHRLVTRGPYALVRHPMYLGILLVGLGGLLIYRTWAFVFFATNFLGLVVRARREEQVLSAEFGEEWQAYCRRVPRFFPHIPLEAFKSWFARLQPGTAALLEVLVLFLPAIPAYLWMWPNVQGASEWVAQILVYVYVLAGTLWIGLRRWNLEQLGINRKGMWLSLVCALAILGGRFSAIQAVAWTVSPPQFSLFGLAGRILYYFGLVGLVEELLFRGLVYRALDAWLGVKWAIWGSSAGFLLWHIFGQGPLIGLSSMAIGLIFALIRWRAGGIVGLILLHGLYDLESVLLVAEDNVKIISAGRPEISQPLLIYLGLGLMLAVPIYLWKLHPLALRTFHRGAV